MPTQIIEAARDIRYLPALFDRDRFGLSVAVGVAYALAVLLFEASEYLASPFMEGARPGVAGALPVYFTAMAALVLLEGAGFVAVVHLVRRLLGMVVAWGALAGGFEAAFRGVASAFGALPAEPLPGALLAASAAADGALLLTGLALAVRGWGVCAEAFVVGAALACLVHAVPLRFVVLSVRPEVAWGWVQFLGWALVRGVITGSLLYAGVAWHLRRRRIATPG